MKKIILILFCIVLVGCSTQTVNEIVEDEVEEVLEAEVFDSILLNKVIQSAVDAGYPGGQLVIVHKNEMIMNQSYGYINRYNEDLSLIDDPKPVTNDTMYDLASVTKMMVTNYLLQYLVSTNQISVDQNISTFFNEFEEGSKSELTIQDLLSHQAGFCADPQFHNKKYKGCVTQFGDNPYYSQNRETTIQLALQVPQTANAHQNQVYSDLDYMLLGIIVEKVMGMPLDEAFIEIIAKPLDLQRTTFNPLANGFKIEDCAATELQGNTRQGNVFFDNIRKNTIQGEVHDEKAYYSMAGVSGHAGLFSNATEVAKLMMLMTNENDLFDEETKELFLTPIGKNDTFGLGWRLQGQQNYSGIFSNYASSSSFGHTGWTGTLIFCDPEADLIVIWLSNKVNTPLVDKKANSNDFEGNHYTEVSYCSIISMSYALISKDENQMKKVISEMMDDSNFVRLNILLNSKD